MNAPVRAWIGLGANIGDPVATLRAALQDLDALPDTRRLRASKLYRTPAWGNVEQADFVNAVALLETGLAARELLDGLLAIERAFGRVRAERWGPRVIDLDLLMYGDAVIDEPGLRVPHPHLQQRAFALVPMLEIDPHARIPGQGAARDAMAMLARDGIEAVG